MCGRHHESHEPGLRHRSTLSPLHVKQLRGQARQAVPNRPPWARDLPTEHGFSEVEEAVKRTSYIDSTILRHSIRMAIIIPVARIVGLPWALTEHQYWVALTVARVT